MAAAFNNAPTLPQVPSTRWPGECVRSLCGHRDGAQIKGARTDELRDHPGQAKVWKRTTWPG
jgi:hypothetical protein